MGFLDILTGGLGGIVGAAGAIGKGILDLKLEGVRNEHALRMREKDLEQARFEAESQLKIHQVDADSAAVTADLAALKESVAADKATYGIKFVDGVRGLVRPVLTAWSAALLTYVTWKAFLLSHVVTPAQADNYISSSLFVASLAVSWWFGSRPQQKRAK